MAIIDEFKSEKNRSLIIQASTKMLFEKYNLSLNADVLQNIIQAIITAMSKDAVLMNNTVKLMELNTITLAKMKDYITKNIEAMNAPAVPVPTAPTSIPDASPQQGVDDTTATNAANAATQYSGYNKGDILTNEELLLRVKEYEHSRVMATTILSNIDATTASAATAATEGTMANATQSNASPAVPTIAVADIMEKVISSMNTSTNTYVNKKTLIINSYSRDWINNPSRNQLSFTVNIDLQSNIIEPLKILFPVYVKDMSPYITMVITDNHRTFKYNFLYSKTSGKWDIWKLINKGNNINNNINLANKKWKINFFDYLNHELNLGRDDIKISQVSDYTTHKYDNQSMDTNIDTILMPETRKRPQEQHSPNLYEVAIDFSDQFEYDEYKLNNISKYDYVQLKTYRNTFVNMKVLEVDNDIGKIIMLNENNLTKEDFVNASLLNYGSQYSLILTYYPIRN
uniref:Uncharacterized protein n=1 Tax=viral metagenome TaxID=1070528 RepID=A0A6C0LJW2_9ZZZZ